MTFGALHGLDLSLILGTAFPRLVDVKNFLSH